MKTPKIYYPKVTLIGKRGMLLPPFGILIQERYKGKRSVLAHFTIHWIQYQKMGLIKFLFRYFFQLLLMGSKYSPFEQEAKIAEKNKMVFDFIVRKAKAKRMIKKIGL